MIYNVFHGTLNFAQLLLQLVHIAHMDPGVCTYIPLVHVQVHVLTFYTGMNFLHSCCHIRVDIFTDLCR